MRRLLSSITAKRYATALAALLLTPSAAHANGDPPSQVLLNSAVYYPFTQPSPGPAQRLGDVVDRANKGGYGIKVAVVFSEQDLGNLAVFFGKPQGYAEHMRSELGVAYRGELLVVMPGGAGVAANTAEAEKKRAIAGIRPEGDSPDTLVRAAERAVRALATADGNPLGKDGSSVLPALLVLGGLLMAGGGAAALRMRRGAPPPPDDSQAPGGEAHGQEDLEGKGQHGE